MRDEADVVEADTCDDPEPELAFLVIWVIELTKTGFVGFENVVELDEIIKVVVDIDGRSDASVCVHKR